MGDEKGNYMAERGLSSFVDGKAYLNHMEEEVAFLEEELVQGKARFPSNITMMNYVDYLLVPSLVYWMEYPRTER